MIKDQGPLVKCNLKVNVAAVKTDMLALLKYCEVNIIEKLSMDHGIKSDKSKQFGINLTHPDMNLPLAKELTVNENPKLAKYIGPLAQGYGPLTQLGVDSRDYTITGDFLNGRYLGRVIEKVKEYHRLTEPDLPPITRVFCAYLGPGAGFKFHVDKQTYYKYHIPIITNRWSFISTEDQENVCHTHIPADGTLWKLNTSEMHTAFNLAPNLNDYRMHIIFNVFK